jgi:hypothetical protein
LRFSLSNSKFTMFIIGLITNELITATDNYIPKLPQHCKQSFLKSTDIKHAYGVYSLLVFRDDEYIR